MTPQDRIIARFQSSKTAGQYTPVLSKLVQQIDAWDELSKDFGPVTKALDLLVKISKMVKEDQDFLSSEKANGLNADAPQQHIDELMDVLHKGQKAAKDINYAYDALNESFLRLGLKLDGLPQVRPSIGGQARHQLRWLDAWTQGVPPAPQRCQGRASGVRPQGVHAHALLDHRLGRDRAE
jgi:hypothetical protein